MNKKHILSTLIIILSFLLVPVCAGGASLQTGSSGKNDFLPLVGQYADSCDIALRTGQYSLAHRHAVRLQEISSLLSDMSSDMFSNAYLGLTYLALDRYDSACHYLYKGQELWNRLPEKSRDELAYKAILTILKGLGIYTTTIEMDFEKATSFFFEGLKIAESRHDDFNYAIMGANLAVVYNMRKDTTGIKYGRQIFEYGLKSQNEYILYTGASVMAIMYHLKGDLEKAQTYIKQAILYSEKNSDKMDCYRLYAEILNSGGRYDEAEAYYRKAQDCLDEKAVTSALTFYHSYSQFLYERHRYDQAMSWIDKALSFAQASNNRLHTYKLYQLKSDIYEQTGQYKTALYFQKKYQQEATEIFNIERERSVSELTRRYEQEHYERKLQEHNLIIMKKKKELQFALFVILFVVAAMIISILLYRHKNRMYLQIARQYKDSIQKEAFLQQQISSLQQRMPASEQPVMEEIRQEGMAEPGNEKNEELFERLEGLMNHDRIYKEKNLTRERVAELIGSNRTYLSQVINEKTGKSFLTYINTYRINEALLILSDVDNKMPLKAISQEIGFSSITTFYKLFHEKVGMTPARYRESIIRISKTDKM